MKEINKIKLEKEITKFQNKYNYTWDKEGKKILLNENKLIITEVEKNILEVLLIQEIPNELNKNLWLISSGARLLLKENKDYYSKLIKFYEKMEEKNHYFYKYETRKISRDLYRSNLKHEEVYKLKNILNAFIARNLTISYCQGLNLIVSYLLQMIEYNEEETFYLFLILMEDILPYDYFLFGIGIEAELYMIKKLLEALDIELYNHLSVLNSFCYLDSKISMWIISLMIYNIDIKITNLFFNIIFLYPNNNELFISILYNMIFSIIAILRNDLLKCVDSNEINNVINKFVNNKISDDNFQKIVYYNLVSQEKNIFKDKTIFEYRKKIIKNIIKERKLNFKFEENIEEIICEKYFPLCIKEKEEKPIEEFIIYKSNNDLNLYLVEDYYYKKDEIEENNKNKEIKINNKNEEINKNNISDKIKEDKKNEKFYENNKNDIKGEIEESTKKENEEIIKKEENNIKIEINEISNSNKNEEINKNNKKQEIEENNRKEESNEKYKNKNNRKEIIEENNKNEEIEEKNRKEEIKNKNKEFNIIVKMDKIKEANNNEEINENNKKIIINKDNKIINGNNQNINNIEEDENIFMDNLIIERRKHFCQ